MTELHINVWNDKAYRYERVYEGKLHSNYPMISTNEGSSSAEVVISGCIEIVTPFKDYTELYLKEGSTFTIQPGAEVDNPAADKLQLQHEQVESLTDPLAIAELLHPDTPELSPVSVLVCTGVGSQPTSSLLAACAIFRPSCAVLVEREELVIA